jgi:Fe-S cluster assembly scaffold protein SufB
MTDKSSHVSLIPEIVCDHKEALLTHEASIGKVSEEQINYLRMRGLTEKQALELIINGFLRL